MLTEPVSENYEDEDENEKISPATMVTTSATTDAVDYAAAMTTSPHAQLKHPPVVEIDLVHQGCQIILLNSELAPKSCRL